jgi:hypothetical protein
VAGANLPIRERPRQQDGTGKTDRAAAGTIPKVIDRTKQGIHYNARVGQESQEGVEREAAQCRRIVLQAIDCSVET